MGGPSTQPTWGGSKRQQWLRSRSSGPLAHAPFSGSRLGLAPAPRRKKGRAGALRRWRVGAPVPRTSLCPCAGPPLPALGLRCSARAARSRSPGRCQVAGPASYLHGPGARRGGRRRPRRRRRKRRRTSRRRLGSRPPRQRRRRLRPGSSALQPAPARPPASLALLSSLWSLALLLPIRLLGLHCRDT